MAVTISEWAALGGEAAAFLDLPARVYADDRAYLPPDPAETARQYNGTGAERRFFVARDDGTPVARVAAFLSRDLRDATGRPIGALGGFEALPPSPGATAAAATCPTTPATGAAASPAATDALFLAARAWLNARGAGQVVGPLDGDTWRRYRVNLGPFDAPPFPLEPWNPPYYAALWTAAGFRPLAGYYSKVVADPAAAAAATARFAQRVQARSFALRQLDLAAFDRDLGLLYQLTTAIFTDNFLYAPLAESDFRLQYLRLRPLLDPELVQFALAPDGRPAGYVFCFPDWQAALVAWRRAGATPAALPDCLRRHPPTALCVKTIGVRPEYRGGGLAVALMHHAYAAAARRGLARVYLCLIHDDNASGRLDAGLGQVLRRYVLYTHGAAADA